MKEVALAELEAELSKYLHIAGEGTVLEDARSLRGIGWEGDLDEMRSGRDAGSQ